MGDPPKDSLLGERLVVVFSRGEEGHSKRENDGIKCGDTPLFSRFFYPNRARRASRIFPKERI